MLMTSMTSSKMPIDSQTLLKRATVARLFEIDQTALAVFEKKGLVNIHHDHEGSAETNRSARKPAAAADDQLYDARGIDTVSLILSLKNDWGFSLARIAAFLPPSSFP